jgi:hypothetical protein
MMSAARRLLMTTAQAALIFAGTSLLVTLVLIPRIPESRGAIGGAIVVLLPDTLAIWWIFRKLCLDHPRQDARRSAIAFAVSAPLTLLIGYLLGELVGGWSEVILGRYFILPAVAVFIIALMISIPGVVVSWALHPSGGIRPVGEHHQ